MGMQPTISRDRHPLEPTPHSVLLERGAERIPPGAILTVPDRVRAICLPSSDPVFQRVVQSVLMSKSITSTRELEDELRGLYPAVRVRRRELSGENGVTWYVYREADFPSSQP